MNIRLEKRLKNFFFEDNQPNKMMSNFRSKTILQFGLDNNVVQKWPNLLCFHLEV